MPIMPGITLGEAQSAQGEREVPQVNSRKWNISATNGRKWNPFFASEAFLECEEEKNGTRSCFPYFSLFLSFDQ